EVSGHRNRVTVESRDSAYSRNGKISDHLQISKRPAYGFHRFGGDAAATNAAELLRVAEWLQVRSGAEIDRRREGKVIGVRLDAEEHGGGHRCVVVAFGSQRSHAVLGVLRIDSAGRSHIVPDIHERR